MVPRKNTLTQHRSCFFSFTFRSRECFLRFCLGDFVGMVISIEKSESFQVCRGPGMFTLEKFVDFALRGGAAIDRSCVFVFGFANLGSGSLKAGLWFEC